LASPEQSDGSRRTSLAREPRARHLPAHEVAIILGPTRSLGHGATMRSSPVAGGISLLAWTSPVISPAKPLGLRLFGLPACTAEVGSLISARPMAILAGQVRWSGGMHGRDRAGGVAMFTVRLPARGGLSV
jgi:hypothetical protein